MRWFTFNWSQSFMNQSDWRGYHGHYLWHPNIRCSGFISYVYTMLFTSYPLLGCSFGLRLAAAAELRITLFSLNEKLTTPPLTFSFALWRKLLPVPSVHLHKSHAFAQTVYHSTCLTFFLHKGDKQMNVKSFPSPSGQSYSSRRTLKVRSLICPFRMKKPQSIQTR